RAPAAARGFQPGQFYRLQNFESLAPLVDGTRLQMEGLALTGAWVDRDAGLLSLIVLEMGSSSQLVAALKPGEPVIVMGPTGAPPVPFTNVRRIIAIGSDRMMAAVARARHNELRALLPPDHTGIASINSPMQCMMKEICAQCLCKHRDPATGKESFVFSCFDQ